MYDVKTGTGIGVTHRPGAALYVPAAEIEPVPVEGHGLASWRVRWCMPAAIMMNIPAESVDDAFAARLTEFMQKMTAPVPPQASAERS